MITGLVRFGTLRHCLEAAVHWTATARLSAAAPKNTPSSGPVVAELPEPWRADFLPTAPPPCSHSNIVTALSWLRRQHPELPLALLGKAFKQRQVRVFQKGLVKRITKARVLAPGDVLLLPRLLVHPSTAAADQTQQPPAECYDEAAKSKQQQQQHVLGSARASRQLLFEYKQHALPGTRQLRQQQHITGSLQQGSFSPHQGAAATQKPPQLERLQQLRVHQEGVHQEDRVQQQEISGACSLQHLHPLEPPPAELQQHTPHQELSLAQQADHPGAVSARRELSVQQVRHWVLASSADLAVVYKPAGVTFDLPLCRDQPPELEDTPSLGPAASSTSSTGDTKASSSSTNEVQDGGVRGSLLEGTAEIGPGSPPGPSPQGGSPDAAVFAAALRVSQPNVPQLLYELPAAASGAVVVTRHATAAAWLRLCVQGEPAALTAPVLHALGGLRAAAAALQQRRRDGPAARTTQQRGRSVRKGQAAQDANLRKLMQLAALAQDHRGGTADDVKQHPSRDGSWGFGDVKWSSSSSGTQHYSMHGEQLVDPLAVFDPATLRQCLLLYERVAGLRLQCVYWAVVQAQLKPYESGTLRDRLCVTRYKVLASCPLGLSLLELTPLTDGPEQLRRHCAQQLQAPVVGDSRFGYLEWPPHGVRKKMERRRGSSTTGGHEQHSSLSTADMSTGGAEQHGIPLLLHCREVQLLRPRKVPVRVLAPLPKTLRSLLKSSNLM